mgnify:CR=1 FL=1
MSIDSEDQLIDVARVSVEDAELGSLIGKTQWELGQDGFIMAEETNDSVSSVEKVSGLYLDNGFGSAMIVNNQER